MVNVLALGAHVELNEVKFLLREKDIKLVTAMYDDVNIEIFEGNISISVKGVDILDFDFVWVKSSWARRQMADAVAQYLDYNEIPHTQVETEHSKLVDNIHLALSSVAIPNTFFCSTSQLINNISSIERVCRYPVILKTTRGSLGSDIFLANNRQELVDVITNHLASRIRYICQEFIPNSYDYRMLVSGTNKILYAGKRVRNGDEFRNNAYLGAEEISLKIQNVCPQLTSISKSSAKALNLEWVGVDVVKSDANGQYYVLELNRRPGLTSESQEVTAAYEHVVQILTDFGAIPN